MGYKTCMDRYMAVGRGQRRRQQVLSKPHLHFTRASARLMSAMLLFGFVQTEIGRVHLKHQTSE